MYFYPNVPVIGFRRCRCCEICYDHMLINVYRARRIPRKALRIPVVLPVALLVPQDVLHSHPALQAPSMALPAALPQAVLLFAPPSSR